MVHIQELYDARVKRMAPAERLQLARLILDDLAPTDSGVDISDEWDEDDVSDVTAFATRHALGLRVPSAFIVTLPKVSVIGTMGTIAPAGWSAVVNCLKTAIQLN